MKISQSVLRRNIWCGVLCATNQEIHEGMFFYLGAHGLCRLFASIFKVTTNQVAGIYAALSPMNGWDTNVSNIITVLRWSHRDKSLDCSCRDPHPTEGDNGFIVCLKCGLNHSISVNTPKINQVKALRIANGLDPKLVLSGRKVLSFHEGIRNPNNLEPIPVDRHLICIALGQKITSNQKLRSFASNRELIDQISKAYSYLGQREGIGNRLASISWFVQRRIESGQIPILQPSRIVCCQKPMQTHGANYFICGSCSRSISRKNLTLGIPNKKRSIPIGFEDGFPIILLGDRKIITLGVSHKWANSAGYQYLSRYRVMKELGRKLAKDEHVHHKDLDKKSDRGVSNYRVLLAETHGKLHTYLAEIAGGRGPDGKFREYNQPIDLASEVPF